MTTPKEFAAKTTRLATTLPRAYATATNEAALIVKDEAIRQLRQVVPSQKLMHGRASLGATFTVTGVANPTALVKATGPWQLVENDTDPHLITSRHGGSTRRRRQARADFIGPQLGGRTGGSRNAALNIPGIGYRRSVRHPGTRGQHPWRKSIERSSRKTPEVFQRAVRAALLREFTGG